MSLRNECYSLWTFLYTMLVKTKFFYLSVWLAHEAKCIYHQLSKPLLKDDHKINGNRRVPRIQPLINSRRMREGRSVCVVILKKVREEKRHVSAIKF